MSLDKQYEEYLDTAKTKLARHQAKKALERKVGDSKGDLDVKGMIIHYLQVEGHNVYYKRNRSKGNKLEYFIGTTSGRIFDLNKTTFKFAEYMVDEGYANETNRVVDYDAYENAVKIEADNWLLHLQEINLSDVMLREENFGTQNGVYSYITGIKSKPSDYIDIYAVYSKRGKKLDIFEEGDYLKFAGSKDYEQLFSITKMIRELFSNIDVKKENMERILRTMDTEFHYRVNKTMREI